MNNNSIGVPETTDPASAVLTTPTLDHPPEAPIGAICPGVDFKLRDQLKRDGALLCPIAGPPGILSSTWMNWLKGNPDPHFNVLGAPGSPEESETFNLVVTMIRLTHNSGIDRDGDEPLPTACLYSVGNETLLVEEELRTPAGRSVLHCATSTDLARVDIFQISYENDFWVDLRMQEGGLPVNVSQMLSVIDEWRVVDN